MPMVSSQKRGGSGAVYSRYKNSTNESQLLLVRPFLYFSFALQCRASVWMFFCIHYAFGFICSCKISSCSLFMFCKSPLNIGCDAGIERPILALEQIDEVEH